jgi:hypothetical protein
MSVHCVVRDRVVAVSGSNTTQWPKCGPMAADLACNLTGCSYVATKNCTTISYTCAEVPARAPSYPCLRLHACGCLRCVGSLFQPDNAWDGIDCPAAQFPQQLAPEYGVYRYGRRKVCVRARACVLGPLADTLTLL